MREILAVGLLVLGCITAWLFYCNKGLKADLNTANAEIASLMASVQEMKDVVKTYAEAEKQAKEFEKELINDTTTDNLDVIPADYILKQLHAD